MAIKLEWILYSSIVLTIASVFIMGQHDTSFVAHKSSQKKELEFVNTTFSEVNDKKQLTRAYAKSGVQINGILNLNNILYSGEKLKSLKADKATYDGNISTLKGNVVLEQENGFAYHTDVAIYDLTKQFVYIPNEFRATMGQNIVNGKDLKYNIEEQNAIASNIDAILHTKN